MRAIALLFLSLLNATRYSKDKYAHVMNLKNEPLSHITPGSKRCKLDEGKDEILAPLSLLGTPSSPTPSLEMMTFSPPTTRSKGKAKGLSSIPSHKLVSRHIHKLVQVLGESLRLTADYLNSEENVVMANSKFEQYFKGSKLFRLWMMKHHSHVADFANLDFEAIDTEILADEANEKEGETIAEATDVVEGKCATTGGATDEAQTEVGRVEEIVSAP
nr:hypothetical protein CFP56_74183 [Quercus suber]